MLKRAKEKAEKAAKAAADAAAYAADQASGMAGMGEDASPFDVAPSADGGGPAIAEQLATLTADDDSKPDEQLMVAMVGVAGESGQPHEQSDLVGAIAARLSDPSATVQNKLLRTTLLLVEKGTPEFGERLRFVIFRSLFLRVFLRAVAHFRSCFGQPRGSGPAAGVRGVRMPAAPAVRR